MTLTRQDEAAACTCDIGAHVHDDGCPVAYVRALEARVQRLQAINEAHRQLNGDLRVDLQRYHDALMTIRDAPSDQGCPYHPSDQPSEGCCRCIAHKTLEGDLDHETVSQP